MTALCPGPRQEAAGYLLGDELDMTMGPGGCTEIKRRNRGLPTDRRLRHANYGKGVLFWQTNSEVACFVNAQGIVSTDRNWFTDNDVCGRSSGPFYLFAGSGGAIATTGSFSIPRVGNAKAAVIRERRALPVTRGSFTDSFADANTIHIYRIDGGSTRGLR